MTAYTELYEPSGALFIQIINLILALILVILPVAAAILLQVYLCKKENRWFGLILPILSGLVSLAILFAMASYVISEQSGFWILLCILYFMLINVPSVIFLLIYHSCRKKYRIKKEMNKMHIQDLE